jgi:hypothetical protein
MITIDEIKEGDKVHYTTPYGKKTNGIVKTIDEDRVFAVYHCDNRWNDYRNYTAALTQLDHLSLGWVNEKLTLS